MKSKNNATGVNKAAAVVNAGFALEAQLQEKLDQSLIREQDKDIEIERLQTTCQTLNAKSSVNDDLHAEIEMLKKRLQENDNQLKIANEENGVLKKENDNLRQ